MEVAKAKRLRELEQENALLKRLLAKAELTSKAMLRWSKPIDGKLHFIQPPLLSGNSHGH